MSEPTLRQFIHIEKLLTDHQVDSRRLQLLFEKGLLADLLDCEPDRTSRLRLASIIGHAAFDIEPDVFPRFRVDYKVPLEEMVKELKIEEVQVDLPKLAALEPKHQTIHDARARLIYFPNSFGGWLRAQRLVKMAGFLLADFRMLLTFARNHPQQYVKRRISCWTPVHDEPDIAPYAPAIGVGSSLNCMWTGGKACGGDMAGRHYLVYDINCD